MRDRWLTILLALLLVLLVTESVTSADDMAQFPVHISVADEIIEGHIRTYRIYDEETRATIYLVRGYAVVGVALMEPKNMERAALPFVASGDGQ